MVRNFVANMRHAITMLKYLLFSPYFWILVISLILMRTILLSQGLPHNGDLVYPSTLDLYGRAFYPLWNEHTSIPNLENIDRMFTFLFIFLARIYGGIEMLSKLLFLFPMIISGFSAALLVKYILSKAFVAKKPNTTVIVAAAFVYMINPWVLEQVQAFFFWFAYAVTPLMILLTFRCFSDDSASFGVGSAILWSLASGSPQYTVFSGFVIFITWFVTFLFDKYQNANVLKEKFRRDLKLWGIMLGVFLIVNAYWIFPIILVLLYGPISPGYTFTKDMLDLFSRNSTILNIIGGVDQWITWYPKISALISWVTFAAVSLSVFFAIALLLRKNSTRLFYVLSVLWIIGVFFALGANNPIYRGLVLQGPFNTYYGWLFRVPGKLSYLLWPAYSASVGLVGQSVYNYSLSKNHNKLKKFVVIAVTFVLLMGAIYFPLTKGLDYFNFYYAPIPIPEPYQQAFDYISEHINNSRIADLAPYDQGQGKNTLGFESSFVWNPGRIAGYFVPRSISAPSVGYYHFTYSSTWQPAYQNLGEPLTLDAKSWFPVYGISYVLFHNDIVGTADFAQHDLQVLNQTGFELVKQWDYIYLYKVPENFGRIYALNYDFSGIMELGKQLILAPFENQTSVFTPTESNDNNRVHITVDSTNTSNNNLLIKPLLSDGWTSIRSETFHPTAGSIFISFDIRQVDANQTHVVIRGFDTFKQGWVQLAILPAKPDGTFSWRTDNYSIQIPGTIETIQVELMAGWAGHNTNESEVAFDNIKVNEVTGIPTTKDVNASDAEIREIKQTDSTRWDLIVETENPFLLVFTEGFDPLWAAKVETNGQSLSVSSQKLFGSINSFAINATGRLEITIEYEPQSWFCYGSIISVSTLLVCLIYLTYNYARNKDIWKRIKTIGYRRKTTAKKQN